MNDAPVFILPVIWLVSWIAAMGVASGKERVFSGVLWGLLFGPLGLVAVLLLPDLKKKRLQEAAAKEADAALLRYQMTRRATPQP